MGIDRLITSVLNFFEVKKTSDKHSFPLLQSKKEIEAAIIEMVDARILASQAREKRKSNSFPAVSSSPPPAFNEAIDALNSAPMPPVNPANWLVSNPLDWIDAYTRWYNGKRIEAIKKAR